MSRVISQERSRKLNVKIQNNAKKFIVKSQVKTNKSQVTHVHIWATTPISRLTCPSQVLHQDWQVNPGSCLSPTKVKCKAPVSQKTQIDAIIVMSQVKTCPWEHKQVQGKCTRTNEKSYPKSRAICYELFCETVESFIKMCKFQGSKVMFQKVKSQVPMQGQKIPELRWVRVKSCREDISHHNKHVNSPMLRQASS